MILRRIRFPFACWIAMLAIATSAAGLTDEERLVAKLGEVSVETDRRTDAFMRELLPRQAALRLRELATPENLASREGRAAMRSGYQSFAGMLDEIEAFMRAEEARVMKALSDATSTFPRDMATQAQRAFERGYARTSERHAALRAAQRKTIRATFQLLDVIDGAPGGVLLANGRLNFRDPEARLRVFELLTELGRLEEAEQTVELEIAQKGRESAQPVPR